MNKELDSFVKYKTVFKTAGEIKQNDLVFIGDTKSYWHISKIEKLDLYADSKIASLLVVLHDKYTKQKKAVYGSDTYRVETPIYSI